MTMQSYKTRGINLKAIYLKIDNTILLEFGPFLTYAQSLDISSLW
jgi:hypothetical protein